jgi:hypothetical protein
MPMHCGGVLQFPHKIPAPPGLIAEIYRKRWDIERLFDETKTKLGEHKAWASSATAKQAQALFLCMAHNPKFGNGTADFAD